jgi:kynurenine formamidase
LGTAIAIGVVSAVHGQPTPTATAAHVPRNAAEFDEMFTRISNWGRWGPNDQLGAANLVTDSKRKQAAALVRTGVTVSLAHDALPDLTVDNPNRTFEHVMNTGFQTDRYTFNFHNFVTSHMDSLCHVLYKDRTYNGYARAQVNTEKGCTKNSIENLKNGVVTRGILIDIPRLKGLPYLEPGTPVYSEDIEAWERMAGVKVSAGDAIFVRTGRWARREKLGPWNPFERSAGLHASVAPWIKDRGVAFVGWDGPEGVIPSLVEGVQVPMHTLLITALGVDIFDSQDLEELSATAARLNRSEFLLTVAPIRVPGGTGSPVNPLAIF